MVFLWSLNPPLSFPLVSAADIIIIEEDDDHPCQRSGQIAIIDLEANDASDTHDAQHKTNNISGGVHRNVKVKGEGSVHSCLWHYIDPQGDVQGPFSLERLHGWWNNGYLPNDFRVWKTGQTSDTAISLIDALQVINGAVPNTGPHVRWLDGLISRKGGEDVLVVN